MNKKYFFLQIFRFNKRMYSLSFIFIFGCALLLFTLKTTILFYSLLLLLITGTAYFIFSSLYFSYLIYDCSDLYTFNWLTKIIKNKHIDIISLYSGYTDAADLLNKAVLVNSIIHLDFYSEQTSTTASIKEAKKQSLNNDYEKIKYNNWEIETKADTILFMQSLHELREKKQRIECLVEASNHLKDKDSTIIIVEHLCDLKNFIIYSIGAFHFFSEKNWVNTIIESGLIIEDKKNITPFIKIFILKKNN